MRQRKYPYLENSYGEGTEEGLAKKSFLKRIDSFVNQKKYMKITLLNWAEDPLQEIEGNLTGGSISKDGSSSIRRTGQLSATVDAGSYDVANMNNMFSINKKIFLEIGIKNYTNLYPEYPILWFPQGVFIISSFSASASSSSALNLSVSIKDKMALLNGEAGGTFQSTTVLDTEDTQLPNGEMVNKKVPIYSLLQEMVHHFGGEALENIFIEDVPKRIKKIVRWMGDSPLYLVRQMGDNGSYTNAYIPMVDKPDTLAAVDKTIIVGEDAGYLFTDFVYDSDLTVNAGTYITSALDQLKSYLGNYEYFYDIYGVFHFREIKNYLNTTQGKTVLSELHLEDYLFSSTIPKTTFTFSNTSNLLSLTSSPQYSNIKNDFVIHGKRTSTATKASQDVMYHLAIDKKPEVGAHYENVLIYKEPDTNLQKATFPLMPDALPQAGEMNSIYYVDGRCFIWDSTVWKEAEVLKWHGAADPYVTADWRDQLYFQGLRAKRLGTEQGYYFPELENAWPQIYDLANQRFYGESTADVSERSRNLTDGNYFLDFIDSSSSLGEFSVSNIGRRSDVVNNDNINCLFQPDIPDVVFLNTDDLETLGEDAWNDLKDECTGAGQQYSQMPGNIYSCLSAGGYKNDAYSQICFELVTKTVYQTTLSATALPAYYLEPNTLSKMEDVTTQTFGEFMVNSVNLPLDSGSQMSVTLAQRVSKM